MKKSINYPMLIIFFIFLQGLFISLSFLTNKPIVESCGIGLVVFIFFGLLASISDVNPADKYFRELKRSIKYHAPLLKEDTALQSLNELFTTDNSNHIYDKIKNQIAGVTTIYHYLYCPSLDKKDFIHFLNNPDKDIVSDWYNCNVFCITQDLVNDQIVYSILFLKFNEK